METEGSIGIQELDRREEMALMGCEWDRDPQETGNPCWLGDQPGPG